MILKHYGVVRGGGGLWQVVKVNRLIPQPFSVRASGSNRGFQFLVGDDAAFLKIDQEHPSWLQSAFGFHILRSDVHDADLTGHNDSVVVRDIVTTRPESIAVKNRTDVVAVCK